MSNTRMLVKKYPGKEESASILKENGDKCLIVETNLNEENFDLFLARLSENIYYFSE